MEKPHKKLDVWQAATKATKVVYELTKPFPEEEKFGLVSLKCVGLRSASLVI